MNRTAGWKAVAGVAALAMVVAACGDDESEDAAGDVEAYCALAAELDEQDSFPTAEQLEALRDAAPEEIRAEIDVVVPAFLEATEAGDPFAAFEDPVVEENIGVIEAFEEETCGLTENGDGEDDGDDEEAAIDPEFADYCGIARILNEQESFPTPEQLEQIRAVAPEEIAAEIDTVVDAFVAAGDDPFAAFEDPAVDDAFGPIEAFDAEHCGIEIDDEEDPEQDPSVTELDPAAARVDVTATDYAFALAPAPAAGRTSFVMTNEGAERHVMLLFRLAEGATMDQVLASEGDEGIEGDELESDSAAPGEEAVLTTDLEPGEYGIVCYIPNREGTPHLALGMVTQFTVV